MGKFIKRILILSIVFLWANTNALAQGCSMCRARIESAQGGEISVGNGINAGIVILMLIPYIVLFFLFRKNIVGLTKEFLGMWKKKK